MNRYPLWKYIVIAIALVVGVLYTLPNFFPEVPAVQVSLDQGVRSTPRCSAPSRTRSRPPTSRIAALRSTRPASRSASPTPTRS
mgnify:CR=1 FL=1